MSGHAEADLVKRIVHAYRARGFPAKIFRGQPYLLREHGWDGPLDPLELEVTYLEEIRRTEQAVKTAVAECFQRWVAKQPHRYTGDRELWFAVNMSPAVFRALGFPDDQARLYESIAQHLHYRGDLWNEQERS